MFWVTYKDIKEFSEFANLPLDESKKVLDSSSGSMEEIKKKWTAHSKQYEEEKKAQQKELKKLKALQKSIPKLVNAGKLGEAILAQNELIELYRVRDGMSALRMVTNIRRRILGDD